MKEPSLLYSLTIIAGGGIIVGMITLLTPIIKDKIKDFWKKYRGKK